MQIFYGLLILLTILKKSPVLTKATFIWEKLSKISNIVKYYCNKKTGLYLNIFKNIIYSKLWCKAEFSASLLQSLASHDHSEIILICWFSDKKNKIKKRFFIINNVENSCAA